MENDFVLDEHLLEKINKFTRKNVTADDVYTFPVVLCDNEIDRDFERFSISALEELSQLFVGKTGIFDHNLKGQNQTARIFDCEVKSDISRIVSSGEPYTCLVAKAYMIRTKKSEDLIAEIEGGIKKEVSVGCSVKSRKCSICKAEQNENPCVHIKGRYYNGNLCSIVLDEANDAYEWSFVAVPAQKNAGVTKTFSEEQSENEVIKGLEDRLSRESEITSKACDLLKREIMALSFICRPIMAVETVKMLTEKMTFQQLEKLYSDLKEQCCQSNNNGNFQLATKVKNTDTCDNKNFKLN